MAERLFITGIGGFIGHRLAVIAQARGFEVSGIDLVPSAVERARASGARAEIGSIDDIVLLEKLTAGTGSVVHTAAIVREAGELAEFRRVNVEGARNVASAAKKTGAHTFVHLSSVMVYGFSFPDHVDEDGPRRGDGNPYCQTKIESEDAVLSLDDPPSFGVIVIRPGDVYGEGSVPWVIRPLQMMRRGLFALPMSGQGIMNHVYVDNLVDAILLAIEKRPHGRAFNVTDGRATTNAEYFGKLAKLAGLPAPRHAPALALKAAGAVTSLFRAAKLTKQELSTDSVKYLMRPYAYSSERAQRELGYRAKVDLDEGLERTRASIVALLA